MRTYDDKIYTNFCSLNVPKDGIKCESFIKTFLLNLYLFMKTNIICKYI